MALNALVGALAGPVSDLLDRLIPDPAAREDARRKLLEAEGRQELERLQAQLSAIVAEAQSEDPWTNRARPSFLYMCYVLILAAIPAGILSAVAPETAAAIIEGFRAWLAAIPDEIVALMAAGYLGYTGARSLDKRKR